MIVFTAMQILRAYMTENDLNQSELADQIGVDRYMISKWINGKKKPRLESLQAISARTGLKLEALVKSLSGGKIERARK